MSKIQNYPVFTNIGVTQYSQNKLQPPEQKMSVLVRVAEGIYRQS